VPVVHHGERLGGERLGQEPAARDSSCSDDVGDRPTGFHGPAESTSGVDGEHGGAGMADLIAIGYPDETTALAAMDEAEQLQQELIIQADAVAAIIRNKEGKIRVVTNHHAVGAGATWGMFWGMLFGMLFFVPFLGMAVGAGMGALMGKVTKSAVDKQFQDQVRDMLQPGTSALFMVVEKVTPDKAVEAMSKFGGTVLKSSLSNEAQQELQEALHGEEGARA
jgi:uncharacterized membrane protein